MTRRRTGSVQRVAWLDPLDCDRLDSADETIDADAILVA